jgi:cytochrome P450
VLYRLLAHPEYIEPLRQEVDAVVTEEGWTKAGMDRMYKIDSFIRETQRVDTFFLRSLDYLSQVRDADFPLFPVSMTRLALRPFTFSNGVTVPAGTYVSIPASATHTDERIYPNPDEFDGFRFSKPREGEGDTISSRYQSVSPSSEHLPFGLGRHAW